MTIKSFKGQLADGGIDHIPLHGDIVGDGFKLRKFQCMADGFGNSEMVLKIYLKKPTAASNDIDFTEDDLIGACMISQALTAESNPEDTTIIFDNVAFNQDIYITAAASSSADPTNYYIELEQIKLNDNEQAVVNYKAALLHGE
jgi:hypothetical protein